MPEEKQSKPWATAIAAILALLLMAFVCLLVIGSFFVHSSASGTLQSGRKVTTETNSFFLSSRFSGDTATINAGRQKILVKPDSVVVDGVKVATLRPETKDVRVSVTSGEVSLVADGESIPLNR